MRLYWSLPQIIPRRPRSRIRRRQPSHRAGRALAPRFGIGESNLAVRREFIRLGEDDRKLLAKLEPWAGRVAADIAREFYDWQFQFPPTLAFFEAFAATRKMPLAAVRQHWKPRRPGTSTASSAALRRIGG